MVHTPVRGSPVPELGEFIIANRLHDEQELNKLLTALKLAAKVVNREINKAGLVDVLGKAGGANIQGEEQQKLDVLANTAFVDALVNRNVVCGICSEEMDDFLTVNKDAHYVISMDPLDGSSNIDCNVSVGTIFSICRRVSAAGTKVVKEDFLQKGRNQICAGYVLYGSSTMMVLTFGRGVHAFTLDPSLGTFFLSHSNIQFPAAGKIYSVNEGNASTFPEGVNDFLSWCKAEDDSRPYTTRYIGSLVSDFHRNMLHGGVYLYPPTKKAPNGKLRLLYECNPMAFLAEQAGGMATSGTDQIMDMVPTDLHQRCPFYTGNSDMMVKLIECIKIKEN
eukprot:Selendium_serpulae@DN4178_c0_g1_i2.p1